MVTRGNEKRVIRFISCAGCADKSESCLLSVRSVAVVVNKLACHNRVLGILLEHLGLCIVVLAELTGLTRSVGAAREVLLRAVIVESLSKVVFVRWVLVVHGSLFLDGRAHQVAVGASVRV